MKSNKDARLEHINDQMKIAELWAQYWLSMATTGVASKRIISHGDGTQFTEEEKIEDAIKTAGNHIHRLRELSDMKLSILNKE